jgi:hypothetical protein
MLAHGCCQFYGLTALSAQLGAQPQPPTAPQVEQRVVVGAWRHGGERAAAAAAVSMSDALVLGGGAF